MQYSISLDPMSFFLAVLQHLVFVDSGIVYRGI